MSGARQVMPDAVWNAFWVILVVGFVLGVMCGAGLISGLGLVIFMAGVVAGFVSWAVALIDPRTLADEPEYQGRDGEG